MSFELSLRFNRTSLKSKRFLKNMVEFLFWPCVGISYSGWQLVVLANIKYGGKSVHCWQSIWIMSLCSSKNKQYYKNVYLIKTFANLNPQDFLSACLQFTESNFSQVPEWTNVMLSWPRDQQVTVRWSYIFSDDQLSRLLNKNLFFSWMITGQFFGWNWKRGIRTKINKK